jgi:hypothetical protein
MLEPEIIVEVPESVLRRSGLDLTEGQWRADNQSGLMYRIEPARPEMRQRRHIHVSHPKHASAPGKQVSWNADGSRHDARSFDASFNGLQGARDLTKRLLKLGPDVKLEDVNAAEAIVDRLLESTDAPLREGPQPFRFRVVEKNA